MKYYLDTTNFLEEISSLSHSIVSSILCIVHLRRSPCYSPELCIQLGISLPFSLSFTSLLFSSICKASSENHFALLHFFFLQNGFDHCFLYNVKTSVDSFPGIVSECLSPLQFSYSVMSNSLLPHGMQHTRLPCPSSSPRAYSNSSPLSQWCHSSISSSVIPFFSCFQYSPATGSFPKSQFITSGGQSTGASALASVLPMNIKDWFALGWIHSISLQSKELSRVFSNTTVQKHQFFGTQLSLQSNSYIHTWPLEKPQLWLDGPLLAYNTSAF